MKMSRREFSIDINDKAILKNNQITFFPWITFLLNHCLKRDNLKLRWFLIVRFLGSFRDISIQSPNIKCRKDLPRKDMVILSNTN